MTKKLFYFWISDTENIENLCISRTTTSPNVPFFRGGNPRAQRVNPAANLDKHYKLSSKRTKDYLPPLQEKWK